MHFRTGVRFPPAPPKKHRNFDTMGIKIAVLSFCPKALISREFGLLRILLMPSRSIAHRQSAPRRYRMTAGYRLFLGLPFNLWAIVYLYLTSDNLPYEKIGDNEPVSIADEIPFDIPDSWEWVRLGSISTYAETKQKVNATSADPSIWGLDLEDIEKGGRLLEHKTVGERKAVGDKTVFSMGDILYSKLRPYLLKILVAPDDGICTPEIVPFRVYGGIVIVCDDCDLRLAKIPPHITDQFSFKLALKYEKAKARLEQLRTTKAAREAQAEAIGAFMFEVQELDALTEFDEKLWLTTIDTVTVHAGGRMAFEFQGGTEIEG